MPAIDPRNIEVIDRAQAELFRQMTMAQRVEMIGASNRAARAMIAAGARSMHPEWSDAQVESEVVRRMMHGTARPAANGG